MPFAAKSAAPLAAFRGVQRSVLDPATEKALTLFTAPAGYLLTESLAATLAQHGRPVMWLRLGPEDSDPGTFLLSLIYSARRLCPDVGLATVEQMRRQPGPVAGWAPLFTRLAKELAEALPPSTAMVLEKVHYLNGACPSLQLLGLHLLPRLPASITCILTTHERLPGAALPHQIIQRGVRELRLDVQAAQALARQAEVDLSELSLGRVMALTEGRAVTILSLCAAWAIIGSKSVQHLIHRAASASDLLVRLAQACLAASDASSLQALILASRLEYSSPVLLQAALGHGAAPTGPWLQPLTDGWMRVRQVWIAPLRAALRTWAARSHQALHRAADYLGSQGASERAVALYLELRDAASAAQAIVGMVDTLLDLGQWQTLSEWLSQLPRSSLLAWPWLIYSQGEIAAAQGQIVVARRAFAMAAELFTACHDSDGACRSLLAESALAAWQGDRVLAQARALAASAVAQSAGLTWHAGWAAWQLGCLAAAAGELDHALACFEEAAVAASTLGDDSLLPEYLREVHALLLRRRDLHRQREFYRQAYFAAERAEAAAAERLHGLLSTSANGLDTLLSAHGWSRTPLMLKLPEPPPLAEVPDASGRTNLWNALLGLLRRRRLPDAPESPILVHPPPPQDLPFQAVITAPSLSLLPTDSTASGEAPVAEAMPVNALTEDKHSIAHRVSPTSKSTVAPAEPGEQKPPLPSASVKKASTAPTLTAHLLGTFRVAVNDRPVERWPKGKGQAVFKYLLTHRDRPMPRDVLTEAFWPGATPEAARNRINVAVHSLRQALRSVTDVAVIVYEAGAYGLNPDLHVWLDADEFERHVRAGHRLETAGQLATATAEYELAASLYQGDFLADDPYEGWPVFTRERLRMEYLDTLDRLSQIYFSQDRYAACVTLCQLILTRDRCREDAHCRLMRCYSRQGQPHLAIRQYQSCVEALRAELDVAPAPITTQLFEQIRQHKRI